MQANHVEEGPRIGASNERLCGLELGGLNLESSASSTFSQYWILKIAHFLCCDEDKEGCPLQDRPLRPLNAADASESTAQPPAPVGATESASSPRLPSERPVPKLQLPLFRAPSGGSVLDEGQISARSFGEDFDILPPAQSRRDFERLRVLRERDQRPGPPSPTAALLAEHASGEHASGAPLHQAKLHQEELSMATEVSTREETENSKIKHLRFLADHQHQHQQLQRLRQQMLQARPHEPASLQPPKSSPEAVSSPLGALDNSGVGLIGGNLSTRSSRGSDGFATPRSRASEGLLSPRLHSAASYMQESMHSVSLEVSAAMPCRTLAQSLLQESRWHRAHSPLQEQPAPRA